MTWIITWNNQEVSSDDFTLDELGKVEQAADTSWSIANPLRAAAVAKEFLRIAITHTGGDPKEADTLTLGRMKKAFSYRADDESDSEGGGEEPDPLPATSHDSSSGDAVASIGRPRKRAANA